MVQSSPKVDEDEIDLVELIRTLLQAWKTIAGITIVCVGLAIAFALHAPKVFMAETLLAPASEEKSGVPSAMSQFGGLAAMAGISTPNDLNIEVTLATLKSDNFLAKYIDRLNLMPVLFEDIWDAENQIWIVETTLDEPTLQKGISTFKDALSVNKDKKSGLINLSICWKDPKVAAEWANDLVKQLNEQLREKAITNSQKRVGYLEQELAKTTLQDMRAVLYNLLESEKQKAMLANVSEDFALQVIDPAVPGLLIKPNRKLIVACGGVCGGFLGILMVFFGQFLQKLKSSSG